MEHPIQGLMTTTMQHLKQMTDVNIVVGDPIQSADGSVILTVSKVSFGFAAGGSEFGKKDQGGQHPFGGGSGGGVSINPVAFLVVNSTEVKVLHLDKQTHIVDKVIELAPQAVEKIKEVMDQKQGDEPEFQI